MRLNQLIAAIGIPVSLFALFLSPMSEWLSSQQALTASLLIITLFLFATSAIPEHVTALVLMTLSMLLALAPAEVVFSGFYSTACWLIFAGLVIGIALNTTGLADRVAACFGERLRSDYWVVITTIAFVSTLTGFIMPSSLGRAVLLVPIAMAIAKQCGFVESSKGYTGVALAVAFGCHVPTFAVLPANVPNMVLIGAAETIHDWTPSYTDYLLLHFPVLGLLKLFIIIAIILWLYPDKPQSEADKQNAQKLLSSDQIQLIILLLITLSFWVTDSIHGISPAWIGLSAACYLLLPKVGLVDKKSFDQQFRIAPLIFVAGFLALGAIINDSGLGDIIGNNIIKKLPFSEGHGSNFMLLGLLSSFTGVLTTLPGVPAILTPFAELISTETGFSIEAVIMTQVLGFSTIIFPFQSAPLVIAMQLAGVSLKHAAKVCLVLTVLTVVVLFPIDYFWWLWLGEIG